MVADKLQRVLSASGAPVRLKAPTFPGLRPTDTQGVGRLGFQYVASVMAAKVGSSREKLVLLGLAGYASNEDGQCWPSIRSLSAKAELSERAVQQSLKRLAEMGLITLMGSLGRRLSFYACDRRSR